MKKVGIILISLCISLAAISQSSGGKVDVLFFCKNNSTRITQSNKLLENKIIKFLNRNFTLEEAVFLSLYMDDEGNFSLVRNYKA